MYKFFCNALVAESVDAADLKSVVRKDVPVQVWPSAPIKSPETEAFLFFYKNHKEILPLFFPQNFVLKFI